MYGGRRPGCGTEDPSVSVRQYVLHGEGCTSSSSILIRTATLDHSKLFLEDEQCVVCYVIVSTISHLTLNNQPSHDTCDLLEQTSTQRCFITKAQRIGAPPVASSRQRWRQPRPGVTVAADPTCASASHRSERKPFAPPAPPRKCINPLTGRTKQRGIGIQSHSGIASGRSVRKGV